ncbi:uncharacterized protein [Panulirus ornatus]|uniref:uncharacterized protein n=1 Tax=Panulirus ornatus TaxID=150431 RepID=UPI003A8420E2
MLTTINLFFFMPLVSWCGVAAGGERMGKQMFQQLNTYEPRARRGYRLCQVDGTEGACLSSTECSRQRGLYAGYCGATQDYCCIVDKTCGSRTSAHHAHFRNPSYPNNDTEARTCDLQMEIGRKVCAVRMTFNKFELAVYQDGVCIKDTMTVLGTSLGDTMTPICGNMTNWATTFAVKERSTVTLAMVVQGLPAYTFSIGLTQLPCDVLVPFQSPTWAGVRNADAVKYVPTTTPPPEEVTETTDFSTTETTEETTTETTTETTSMMSDDEETTDVPEAESPTTLTPGKIPTPSNNEVLIRAPSNPEEDVYLETTDATPAISAFRRAFEQKVNDRCWQYEEDDDTGFRIIGGAYANINEYPWQVGLVYKKKFFCGGSLISDRHVLTASHCVFGSFSKGLDNLIITIGDHDLSTRNETNHVVARVKSIHWHLHYNPHATTNDIAIMELREPVNFTYGISAVKLPTDLDEQYELANATVTGWGRYHVLKKKTSAVLKEFTGPLQNTSKCVEAWKKFPGINASLTRHICLSVTMGTPCHGDSGGPLVVCTGVQCTQVGVVSFGFPLCTNVGLPAVFSRITYFRSWLDMNLVQMHYE